MSQLDQAAWQARQHDVVTGRTRKGRTTQRVVRFGAATVQGALDLDADGRPLLATSPRDQHVLHPSAAAARQLVIAAERGNSGDRATDHVVSRRRHGLSAIDITAITDATYRDWGLPALITGTEVRQYEQVIHRDRAAASRVTAHSVGLDGGYVDMSAHLTADVVRFPDGTWAVSCGWDTIRADIAVVAAANAPQTGSGKAWPTRVRLTAPRRKSDPRPTVVGTVDREIAGPTIPRRAEHSTRKAQTIHRRRTDSDVLAASVATFRVVALPAAHVDSERIWVGHTLTDRAAAVTRTTDALEQRTTNHAGDEPTTRDGWAALLARLTPGERIRVGATVATLTAAGDRWVATFPGQARPRIMVRSAAALADRLAAA